MRIEQADGGESLRRRVLICVRVVGGDELDVAVHQGGDEGEIAGQAVEFGNDQLGLVLPARGQGRLEVPKCALMRPANAKSIGWAIYAAGFVIWLFGYLSAGHAAAFDWDVAAPSWISGFVPNLEAEFGLALMSRA